MRKRSPYSLVDVNKIVPEQLFPPAAEGGQACNDSSPPRNDSPPPRHDPPSPRNGSPSPRRPLWLGVDVGKYELAVCLTWADGRFERPWRVKSPDQTLLLVEIAARLSERFAVTIALESSGTYGDALRQACTDAGLAVVRVSAKAVKDEAETFDGVPSQHDGKDAAVIASLAHRGKSTAWPWQQRSEFDQALRYWVRTLDAAQRVKQMHSGRLEALLGRHWPEATGLLSLSGATLPMALSHWGDPTALSHSVSSAVMRDLAAGTQHSHIRHRLRKPSDLVDRHAAELGDARADTGVWG